MKNVSVKEQARVLVERLPDDASWEDLMRHVYVNQAVEAGMKDMAEGRELDVAEVRKRFGLDR